MYIYIYIYYVHIYIYSTNPPCVYLGGAMAQPRIQGSGAYNRNDAPIAWKLLGAVEGPVDPTERWIGEFFLWLIFINILVINE